MDLFTLGVVLLVGAGALVGLLLGRIWPLLLLLPPLLGLLAWYGWEFSGIASLYVAAIVVLGYIGLAIGFALRGPWRRARRRLGRIEL